MSTGGTVSLIESSDVHPDNLSLVIRAAQAANLDLAGVDLLIPDISKSWLESDAIICEINAQPQIGSSVTPHIYEDILNTLLNHKKGIPLHLVIYPTEKQCIKSSQIDTLQQKYQCNTLAMKSGLWIDSNRITKTFDNSFMAIKALIHNQAASSALCIMNQQDVEDIGLPMAFFSTIDVYCAESFKTKAMTSFINKIKGHTHQLQFHNIRANNELQ